MIKDDLLREYLISEGLEDSIIFENPSYESAIVGYDIVSNRIVYDFEKMVEDLEKEDGISREDAIDFIMYNTVRALSYQENGPIIINMLEI